MKRAILQDLIDWKSKANRLPIILRGARQVGKSYLIEAFGKKYFDSVVTINLELRPNLIQCFETLDPAEIIRKIEALLKVKVHSGNTLLFIDEIQFSPKAIQALRYFKELMPELHVIAAGSLLEFTLYEESFSFPVGRVQFMYLKPLTFSEFLLALGYEQAHKALEKATVEQPLYEEIHHLLLGLVRQYFLTGGMPAVVQSFLDNGSFLDCERLQTVILDTYRNDFGKYATKAQYKHLQKFFEKSPNVIGEHFKYSKIDSDIRSRELKVAFKQLCWAGLLTPIYLTNASGIPLRYHIKEKKFKILFLDIGLLQRANQIDSQAILEMDLHQINQGMLAEQFVGQELLAYSSTYEDKRLYYWEREARGSSSEVDYVMNIRSKIIPIEVKAGKTGRIRSMRRFMEEKEAKIGVRISKNPLSLKKGILSVPFYLIEQIPRLVNAKI